MTTATPTEKRATDGAGRDDRAAPAGAGRSEKRSRADQREATRARLIDATFSCLVERGYAGTSTALIATTAGVSHGSLFNHFASKDELMSACITEVLPRFMAENSERLLQLAASDQRTLDQVVDVLWEQFSGPTMQATRELMMAGRTNSQLGGALAGLDGEVKTTNHQIAALLVPELADHPMLPAYVGLTLAAIDGAIFSIQSFHNPARHRETKSALVHALELLVAEATTERPSD